MLEAAGAINRNVRTLFVIGGLSPNGILDDVWYVGASMYVLTYVSTWYKDTYCLL